MNSDEIRELATRVRTKSCIRIEGMLISNPELVKCKDKYNLWRFEIQTDRKGKHDEIVCMIEDRLYKDFKVEKGQYVAIEGEIRTYRNTDKSLTENRTLVYVFVKCIIPTEKDENSQGVNDYTATGVVSSIRMLKNNDDKDKITICEFDVAVVSKYGNCFYIPCVAWGLNADYVVKNGKGSVVECAGRFQSRNYTKVVDGKTETRVFYEVAIRSIRPVQE